MTGIKSTITVDRLEISIRDYPLCIISLKYFSLEGTHYIANFVESSANVDCFGLRKFYYDFETKIDSFQANVG